MPEYAVTENNTKGRQFTDSPHRYRTDFDRDRDRIIHSEAFRRLEGKTQVFTPGLNDNFRNRLTHSIEVAQIGRTIARNLHLNETLTEAICLAHDLGHPPFGHTGENVLNELMTDPCFCRGELVPAQAGSGFEHNAQTLHIVDFLEHPYPDFAGLNLLYETRLGLAKHSSPYDKSIDSSFAELNCSLEGQIAGIADRIAYNCHDLEDGLRARILNSKDLMEIELFADARKSINAESIEDHTIRRTRTAKAIINKLVGDCIETSKEKTASANIKTIEDIYKTTNSLISITPANNEKLSELESFLMQNLYLHESVRVDDKAGKWLGDLFKKLCDKPDIMPGYFQKLIETQGLQRTVCDYIAGMTDRYCIETARTLSA